MVIVKEIIRTYYSCEEYVKLDVDSAISELSEMGILTEIELVVISITKEQYSLTLAGEMLGMSKSSVGRVLDIACEKIANFLGEEYQECKIIEAAENKLGRKFTKEEKEFCMKKMKDFGRNKYAGVSIFNFKGG